MYIFQIFLFILTTLLKIQFHRVKMLSVSNQISTHFKNSDAKDMDTKLKSAVFGGERKYNAILRANTIQRYFIDNDDCRSKKKDVEDEIKCKSLGSSIDNVLYSNESNSVSMFFEDINIFRNADLGINLISHYNGEKDIESIHKSFNNDKNEKVKNIYQQKKQNNNFQDSRWTTDSASFATNDSFQEWKDIGFKDIMENSDLNTTTEKENFSDDHDIPVSYKQGIQEETEKPLASVNLVFANMIKSMLIENFHHPQMIEKISESVTSNDFAIQKFGKYCYSENLGENDPEVQSLLEKYLEKHKKVMESDILELSSNELFNLSRNNVKTWFSEKQCLILKTMGEPDCINLNLDVNMVNTKYNLKGSNKLRKEFLYLMESFLQAWWHLEIETSNLYLRKGLAKHVKNLKILFMQEKQFDNDLNVDITPASLVKKLKGRSLKRIFSMNDKKVDIRGMLMEFLDLQRYIFEDTSEDEIIIVGKN